MLCLALQNKVLCKAIRSFVKETVTVYREGLTVELGQTDLGSFHLVDQTLNTH